jgi:hypothetical protein
MKHNLMFLEMDSLIIEPNFVDNTAPQLFEYIDDRPYVFEFSGDDNPMDADDPESALKDYYNQVLN